jgi:hypothetical protein
MADQWNANIPAVGNQVAEDIADIKENLEHAKDAFQRIFETWSDTAGGNAAAELESSVGFSDGTYTYDFPTNGVAGNSIIMLGNSSTVVWMYLNTAPPGWLVLATGKDTVLAVAADSGDYNVNGGNPDTSATWTQDTHVHQWYNYINTSTSAQSYNSAGSAQSLAGSATSGTARLLEVTQTSDLGTNADQYTTAVAPANTWRPKASVGKLFQLDTAA